MPLTKRYSTILLLLHSALIVLAAAAQSLADALTLIDAAEVTAARGKAVGMSEDDEDLGLSEDVTDVDDGDDGGMDDDDDDMNDEPSSSEDAFEKPTVLEPVDKKNTSDYGPAKPVLLSQ